MSHDNRDYSSDSPQSVGLNMGRYNLYEHQLLELRIYNAKNSLTQFIFY